MTTEMRSEEGYIRYIIAEINDFTSKTLPILEGNDLLTHLL